MIVKNNKNTRMVDRLVRVTMTLATASGPMFHAIITGANPKDIYPAKIINIASATVHAAVEIFSTKGIIAAPLQKKL
jgi:5,10-methylenetetrahydrofolate reductase